MGAVPRGNWIISLFSMIVRRSSCSALKYYIGQLTVSIFSLPMKLAVRETHGQEGLANGALVFRSDTTITFCCK